MMHRWRVWRRWPAVITGALACVSTAAAPPPVVPRVSSGNAPPAGFAQALEVRPFVFPHDHGPHPEFRQEWWYVTGNLGSPEGERFGFELTFFRIALAPPPAPASAAAPLASAWRTREIYVAHFAVTDVARARFRSAQKLSRAALGLAGAQAQPLHVWIDDWSLAAADGSSWKLHAAQPGYEIQLALEPQSAPVLNGSAGLSRKSAEPTDATYYYSIPRLKVRGQLRRGAQTIHVQGLAWLDREWGSGALGANEVGWDWFGLQLSDGTALMFYALRDRDGSRDVHSGGTWIAADGAARQLLNRDVEITVTDQWRNPAGEPYPSRWHIQVPALALQLDVRPLLADQELATRPRYWEGAVEAGGERAGESVSGRGYVELVGYARDR
jgi:predicted secreted hydrolase